MSSRRVPIASFAVALAAIAFTAIVMGTEAPPDREHAHPAQRRARTIEEMQREARDTPPEPIDWDQHLPARSGTPTLAIIGAGVALVAFTVGLTSLLRRGRASASTTS